MIRAREWITAQCVTRVGRLWIGEDLSASDVALAKRRAGITEKGDRPTGEWRK